MRMYKINLVISRRFPHYSYTKLSLYYMKKHNFYAGPSILSEYTIQ